MKKITITLSHLGVIGLALLALLIGTLVWMFERLRGRYVRAKNAVETAQYASALKKEIMGTAIELEENPASETGLAATSEVGD